MLQTAESDHTSILSEFLQKMVLIFGSQVIRTQLQDIHGLVFDSGGVVQKFEGDPKSIHDEIVKRLSVLSEFAVKSSLDSVVVAHTQSSPTPADISHLPSTEEKILQSLPLASNPQSTS